MPMVKERYPDNWPEIRRAVMDRAGEIEPTDGGFPAMRMEASCELCQAENHKPHPITGSRVVLTIAHMDDEMRDGKYIWNDPKDLLALCQRCHNKIDGPKRRHREKAKKLV